MIAFDADVLIYAAAEGHQLGERVRALLEDDQLARVGSTLLLPEVMARPVAQDPTSKEVAALAGILSRVDLLPLDAGTARLAVALGARYGLRAADATHLATAVAAGADTFLTNNSRDFSRDIKEVAVVHPGDLPAAS